MADSELERLVRVREMTASGEARRRRLQAALSLQDLSTSCGVEPGTIWKWETGSRRPRRGPGAFRYLDALNRLAVADRAGQHVAREG